jgi:pimeloyl-ACP methyl ester carboxylesterase
VFVDVRTRVGTAGIDPEAREAYVASVRRQVSGIPYADVCEVPTARHFIQLDDSEALHRAMDEFLARRVEQHGLAGRGRAPIAILE